MNYRRNIVLLYLIAFLQGMVFYGPIATLYRQAAGVGVFQITIIESISMALCIFLEIPWGIAADRIGYRATMIICCVLYFLSKIVFWQADGFGGFLLERIMLSVIMAGISGVDASILFLSCPKEESQKIFGWYGSLCTAGLLTAALVYAAFIGNDFRLAGLLTVISYGAAAVLSFGLVEVKRPRRAGDGFRENFLLQIRENCRNRKMILFLAGVALLNETHQTVTVFLNQLQYARGGLSAGTMGYIYIVVTVIGLFGSQSYRITRRMGARKTCLLLYSVSACACLAMALTANPVISVLSVAALRLSFSLFQPLQLDLQSRKVLSGNRATALSINAAIIDGTGAATNIAFGKAADISLPAAMLLGFMFCIAGLIFILKWHIRSESYPAR